jgi:hypothetical protein
MEILTLPIKSNLFQQILAGRRKEEIREITPSTQSKYLTVAGDEVTIKLYDAIRFVAGNTPDSPEALVRIDHIDLEYEADDDGYIQLEELEDGRYFVHEASMVYTLGEVLQTRNLSDRPHRPSRFDD